MKKLKFEVPLYYIDVTLVQIEDKNDVKKVLEECEDIKIDDDERELISQYIKNGSTNGGDTYRNFSLAKMLVIFYPFTTNKMRYNVYSHEKRHIEDRILEHANVDDIESSAYLAGFLGEKFHEFEKMTETKKFD